VLYRRAVVEPREGGKSGAVVIIHLPGAKDGEGAVGKRPGEALAAGA
jgi:hypothetical protein